MLRKLTHVWEVDLGTDSIQRLWDQSSERKLGLGPCDIPVVLFQQAIYLSSSQDFTLHTRAVSPQQVAPSSY